MVRYKIGGLEKGLEKNKIGLDKPETLCYHRPVILLQLQLLRFDKPI